METYKADELKDILESLIKARHITLEQATEQVRAKNPDMSEVLIELSALLKMEHDLIETLIDAIPKLIEENNQRWLQLMSQ